MKSIIILLTGPLMLILALAALQTIEWNWNEGNSTPFFTYIILLVVAAWCVMAATTSRREMNRGLRTIERWFDKLFGK